MKRCPQCDRVESDETLKFCRADGAALIIASDSVSAGSGTMRFGSAPSSENKTSVLPHRTEANINRATTPTTVLPAEGAASTTGKQTKSRRQRTILMAFVSLIIVSVAVAIYLYVSRRSTTSIQSIAVMPFVNESGNADVEYLSDGMTESLMNSLSQLPGLSVKARSSVFRYKGKETNPQTIGKELGVQAILNGRIVRRDNDLAVFLELVDTQTGDRIWGEQYHEAMSSLVSLQNEIAKDVSQKLRAKLSGEDQHRLAKTYTHNAEAYQLYLQGRFYWNKRTVENFKLAINCFEKALAIDPNYALDYTGLADSYALLSVYDGATPKESMPKAKEAALKALALDNELAEAHASLGQIFQNYDYDFTGAEREYKRAIELNPNYASAHQWYGELLANLGRFDESTAELQRASEIDPLSLIINRMKGSTLFFARKYDASIDQLKRTVALDANFPGPHYDLFLVYHIKGAYAESVEEFARWRELEGDKDAAVLARQSFAKDGWQGFLRAMTDRSSRPAALHPYHLAIFYVALGENALAMDQLNAAYDERANDMYWLKQDPRLDPLRSDPRFQQLIAKVGFPQ